MNVVDIAGLAELAYAAALDDGLWAVWAQEMITGFGVQGALFWVIDTQRAEMRRSAFHFNVADPETLAAEYLETQVEHDPQMRRVLGAGSSEVYTDLDHVNLECAEDRDYLAWQHAQVGTTHHLTAAAVLSETLRAGIALHTSPDAGPASGNQRAALIALFPHIARAMRLGLRHNALLDEAWWDGIDRSGAEASILLDKHGRVLRLSAAAEQVIAAGDGLRITGNRLFGLDGECDGRLEAAIQAAVNDREPRSSATTLVRRSGRKAYLCLVYPLVRKRRFLAPHRAAALVHIVDPTRVAARLSEVQRALFGLTEREVEVADLLLSGHSPESLAAVLEISRNTARVHLQSLFRKTGTNRQSELVRILLAAR